MNLQDKNKEDSKFIVKTSNSKYLVDASNKDDAKFKLIFRDAIILTDGLIDSSKYILTFNTDSGNKYLTGTVTSPILSPNEFEAIALSKKQCKDVLKLLSKRIVKKEKILDAAIYEYVANDIQFKDSINIPLTSSDIFRQISNAEWSVKKTLKNPGDSGEFNVGNANVKIVLKEINPKKTLQNEIYTYTVNIPGKGSFTQESYFFAGPIEDKLLTYVSSFQAGKPQEVKAQLVSNNGSKIISHNELMHLAITGYNTNEAIPQLAYQPHIKGYIGPMYDGGYLRYETQEVYDRLSDSSDIKVLDITLKKDMSAAEDIIRKYGGEPTGNVQGLMKTRFVNQNEITNQFDFRQELFDAGYLTILYNGRYRVMLKDSIPKNTHEQINALSIKYNPIKKIWNHTGYEYTFALAETADKFSNELTHNGINYTKISPNTIFVNEEKILNDDDMLEQIFLKKGDSIKALLQQNNEDLNIYTFISNGTRYTSYHSKEDAINAVKKLGYSIISEAEFKDANLDYFVIQKMNENKWVGNFAGSFTSDEEFRGKFLTKEDAEKVKNKLVESDKYVIVPISIKDSTLKDKMESYVIVTTEQPYKYWSGKKWAKSSINAEQYQTKVEADRVSSNVPNSKIISNLEISDCSINLKDNDYELLSRLESDCKYFLGAGKGQEKHLWAYNVVDQIKKMKELYNKLPEKPEWLTLSQINEYERKMKEMKNSYNTTTKNDSISDLDIIFKGVKLEFVEGQHSNSPINKLLSIEQLDNWLLKEDEFIRTLKNKGDFNHGYDKAYIDYMFIVDNKPYRVHGVRKDLGDGQEHTKLTSSDYDWARKQLLGYLNNPKDFNYNRSILQKDNDDVTINDYSDLIYRVRASCTRCPDKNTCIHHDAFRRLPREIGGLALCPRLKNNTDPKFIALWERDAVQEGLPEDINKFDFSAIKLKDNDDTITTYYQAYINGKFFNEYETLEELKKDIKNEEGNKEVFLIDEDSAGNIITKYRININNLNS